MEAGLKLTVTPAGWPDADSAMAELNPLSAPVVMVELPLPPGATETAVGEAEMVKLGEAAAVTVRVMVAVCVTPPPVPVTVMG